MAGAQGRYTVSFPEGQIGIGMQEHPDGVHVSSIKQGSLADKNGHVGIGHVLCGINGQSVVGKHWKEIYAMMQKSGRPMVLEFRHSEEDEEQVRPPPGGLIKCVFGEGSLGFGISKQKTIQKILGNSQAASFAGIAVGDLLYAIEDEKVSSMSLKEMVQHLKVSQRPLTITFQRPLEETGKDPEYGARIRRAARLIFHRIGGGLDGKREIGRDGVEKMVSDLQGIFRVNIAKQIDEKHRQDAISEATEALMRAIDADKSGTCDEEEWCRFWSEIAKKSPSEREAIAKEGLGGKAILSCLDSIEKVMAYQKAGMTVALYGDSHPIDFDLDAAGRVKSAPNYPETDGNIIGQIRAGMVLTYIGDMAVDGINASEIESILTRAPRPVQLVFREVTRKEASAATRIQSHVRKKLGKNAAVRKAAERDNLAIASAVQEFLDIVTNEHGGKSSPISRAIKVPIEKFLDGEMEAAECLQDVRISFSFHRLRPAVSSRLLSMLKVSMLRSAKVARQDMAAREIQTWARTIARHWKLQQAVLAKAEAEREGAAAKIQAAMKQAQARRRKAMKREAKKSASSSGIRPNTGESLKDFLMRCDPAAAREVRKLIALDAFPGLGTKDIAGMTSLHPAVQVALLQQIRERVVAGETGTFASMLGAVATLASQGSKQQQDSSVNEASRDAPQSSVYGAASPPRMDRPAGQSPLQRGPIVRNRPTSRRTVQENLFRESSAVPSSTVKAADQIARIHELQRKQMEQQAVFMAHVSAWQRDAAMQSMQQLHNAHMASMHMRNQQLLRNAIGQSAAMSQPLRTKLPEIARPIQDQRRARAPAPMGKPMAAPVAPPRAPVDDTFSGVVIFENGKPVEMHNDSANGGSVWNELWGTYNSQVDAAYADIGDTLDVSEENWGYNYT